MKTPLISIITVCFNSEKTICRTIESVLGQTYTNIEYILIDGKSTDNTVAIIEKYAPQFAAKGIIYRYISEPDNGIYDAMNKGIKMATGAWVGIINSDDWYEQYVCNQVSVNSNGVDVIYGLQKYWNNDEVERVLQNHHTRWSDLTMAHSPIFIRKSLYEKFGYFDLQYKLAADYKLVINLTHQKDIKFKMLELVFSNFSLGGASGRNNFKASNLETLDIQLYYQLIPFWKYCLKKIKVKLWR